MNLFHPRRHLIVAAALLLVCAGSAHADLPGAQKALDDAKKNAADNDWNKADTNVKLAEVELDGVPAADRKAVQDQLDAIKKQIADTQASAGNAAIVQRAEGLLADAKKYTVDEPDPSGVLRDADELDEYLNKDETKAAIPADQIAKYRAQMAKYKAVASAKHSDLEIDNVNREYQRLHDGFDAKMAELKSGEPGSHQFDMDTLGRDLEILHNHLNALPQDNAKVKAMVTSFDQMNTAYSSVANSNQATEVLRSLKGGWEIYANEYKGWEAENSPPTFEQFTKESSQEMSAFRMPRSIALINRADQFLDNRKEDKDYAAVASTPQIKALIDNVTKTRADAYAKVLKAATGIVEQAEKTPIDQNTKRGIDKLPDSIRLALGEKSTDTAALQARVAKLAAGFEAAAAGADQAKVDAYKQLKEQATKDWPDMKARFHPVDGFDPNNYKSYVGKQIHITTDNLMGYRFNPGDFPFATTLNGEAVACRYSPAVRDAVKDVEKKIGRGLGDSDDDGKWEIICVVDGTTGKLLQRKQLEGDLKTGSGENVGKYQGEYSEPVEAPIVTIVAAHCGPLAVAANSGEVAQAAASSSWLRRIIFLIVGLTAAAAALLKANFEPLAAIPQVGQVQTRIGSNNLAYIGLACAALGVLWLLLGYIIFGLLVNLAVIAAGLYAALDLLTANGIVKPDLAQKIRPLGVPIGLACAALVILELLVQGRFYIL